LIQARVAALCLALAACSRSPTFAARPVPAGPAPTAPAPTLRLLHIGDFGDTTRQREAVAAAIVRAHGRAPFDLVLSAGDNLYESGPEPVGPESEACAFQADGNTVAAGFHPPPDPRFVELFEGPLRPLQREGSPVPVYLVLGNHDVHVEGYFPPGGNGSASRARLKACLEVAHRSPQWSMPGRHYVLDLGPARIIAIDSNLLIGDYGGFTIDAEVAFVEEAARGCTERACFVLAHHPAVTAGGHRKDATAGYLARLARLEAAAGGRIRAWLAGHDHDLQHLRAPAGYDVLVSGNTSRGRPRERFEVVSVQGASLLFGSTSWGYGRLDLSPQGWSYRFENDRSEPLYCCAADGPGPCQPVECTP